jgi:amino acid transporter/mannitol/fructose-specific phosphotransferase system IIA component (Ntr-type)
MKLKKSISFMGVFSIATGAMISSGIFILPGFAFDRTGPSVFISYFIGGLLGLTGILSVIELSTAMPKSGGDYYFINKTFGPALGTMSGFLGWFALSLKSAFAIFGIAEIVFIFTGINILITGFVLCIFFIFLNIKGVEEAVRFQIILVSGLVILLILYLIFGFPKIDYSRYTPLLKNGINEVFITSGFIFISFGGLLNVANIAEEVIKPSRNIPLGILVSIITVTFLYTAITFVITGTLGAEEFAGSLTPVADSAKVILGNGGYFMILAASLLAFLTTANAGLMSASRYPLSLSHDRLLPPIFTAVNRKFGTPSRAIIATGVLIYLSLFLPLEILVKAASTVILTSYVLTNISVLILRESRLTNYRPTFKTPLYPFLQIFCIILFSFFIFDMGLEAIEISLSLIILSFSLYMIYGRKVQKKETALLHLLKRLTDQKIIHNMLEDELREVVIHRDEIEQDNFDELIKNSQFIEIEGSCNFSELMDKCAGDIAEETGMPVEMVKDKFLLRQQESNTAVSQFLAIPHIILEGNSTIFLKIIRCRDGIYFSEKESAVKAVFLLGGTGKNRILHLKTLASIVNLVRLENFENEWLSAQGNTEIKNLMILNERKRY